MTFEDETNAKLPAISCFIKLGDKYIKHKNNNNKNKKNMHMCLIDMFLRNCVTFSSASGHRVS